MQFLPSMHPTPLHVPSNIDIPPASFVTEFAFVVLAPVIVIMNIRLMVYPTVVLHVVMVIFILWVPRAFKCSPSHSSLPTVIRRAVTSLRSGTLLMTCIAILAVDLPFFAHCCSKSRFYGASLMDFGSGGFVVMSAFVHKPLSSLHTSLSNALKLAALGTARLVLTTALAYNVDEREYGMHFNFFFLLAVLHVVIPLLERVVPSHLLFLFGAGVSAFHQYSLSVLGLRDYIFSEERRNIVEANKEGISQIIGFIALYCLAFGVINYMRTLYWTGRHVFTRFVFLNTALWVAVMAVSVTVDMPSRRTGNLAYVLWVLATAVVMLSLTITVESIEGCSALFYILEGVNRYALETFLAANVMVGLMNLGLDLGSITSPYAAFGILAVYTVILCGAPTIFLHKSLSRRGSMTPGSYFAQAGGKALGSPEVKGRTVLVPPDDIDVDTDGYVPMRPYPPESPMR
eukprot:TRINITY_DN1007_c0_g1_i4.p1 TRINITY_DN1007_c0_g1~~TRINITY_DN1007_c0_g1_i4.p1  ORF type:complete len:458 (-),score=-4.81 TRINITY_DN1007_c0_g1_i4:43-1416(-)